MIITAPRSRFLLEKQKDSKPVMKFPAFHVTPRLISVLIHFNNNNNYYYYYYYVIKKETKKILKYKDLTIEIQRMWNAKTTVIPVIIVATGTISKSFRKYMSNIPGKHEVKELQKTAILGTAHILWKVLM